MTTGIRDTPLAELVCTARSPGQPGREAAFSEIVRRFRANAQASAFHLLRDAHLAQDVAQEALLDAYLGLGQLREPAAFPGWFRRIVFKHADRVRRRSRRVFEELASVEALPHDGANPEAWIATRENIVRVRKALSALPEHERGVVVLFYFAERSHAEIGERLDLPISTVKKRLHDARQRLRIPLERPDAPATIEDDVSRGAAMAEKSKDSSLAGEMALTPVLQGPDALRLATLATPETRAVLRHFAPEQVASALVELSARDRVAFLEVADRLPEIVPCLPELTLIQTIRGEGLDEAGWLVEFASPEQRIAALDLDCWQNRRLSPSRVFEWIDTMIEAGTETLVAAFDDLDAELWILALQWMAEFSIPGHGDAGAVIDPEDESDFSISDGCTEDGVVFFECTDADHEERLRAILSAARIHRPSHYWDFVYGAVTEPPDSCEEVAARWHAGRLNDLGFPDLGHAMGVYRRLPMASVPRVESLSPPPAECLPIPAPLSGSSLGRAISELPAERASEIQNELLVLANAIAVADRLPLAESAALEGSLRKALEGVDRGLVALAADRHRSLAEIADTNGIRDLFRVGVTLHPELHPQPTLGELEDEEELAVERRFDWSVVEEWLDETDATLRADGRLQS